LLFIVIAYKSSFIRPDRIAISKESNMKSRVTALLLASILLPTASPVALAQTSNTGQTALNVNTQDWQGLRDLKPGKKIVVEFKLGIGESVEGKFVSAIGSKLTLTGDGYTRSLEQRDIQRVYRLKGRWTRDRAAGIGAGIGLLAGAAIGGAIVVFKETDTAASYEGAFLGLLGGLGLGALLGGKRNGQLLYESK
jgi:hypothetical protein